MHQKRARNALSRLFCISLAVAAGRGSAAESEFATPVAPAFTVLGVAPEAVARPTTPRALAVEALSQVSALQDGSPDTYALQVAPYWLLHEADKLTADEYLKATAGKSILYNFTLSFAATPTSDLKPEPTPGVGIGLRSLWFLSTDSRVEKALENYRKALEENRKTAATQDALYAVSTKWLEANKVDETALRHQVYERSMRVSALQTQVDLLEAERKAVADAAAKLDDSPAKTLLKSQESALTERSKAIQELLKAAQTELTTDTQKLVNYQNHQNTVKTYPASQQKVDEEAKVLASKLLDLAPRRGLALEAAFATGIIVPAGRDTPAELSRVAAWLTAGWRAEEPLELLALFRVIENDVETSHSSRFVEYGGRIVARGSTLTTSLEIVKRDVHHDVSGPQGSYRIAGIFELPVTEDVKVDFTIAKNFESRTVTTNTFIAALGVKLQLGGGVVAPAPKALATP